MVALERVALELGRDRRRNVPAAVERASGLLDVENEKALPACLLQSDCKESWLVSAKGDGVAWTRMAGIERYGGEERIGVRGGGRRCGGLHSE